MHYFAILQQIMKLKGLITSALFLPICLFSQTETDGLFMAKNNFCGGLVAGFSQWNQYWEGSNLRINENIGTVSSKSLMMMGNYGINTKTNAIFTLPYIQNQASAGTLIGQQGIQDLNIYLKRELVAKNYQGWLSSLNGVVGVGLPMVNYVADYLPLSIGMKSQTATARLMLDVQKKQFFFTASVFGMARRNIQIDRDAYYTTKMIYSNTVQMPTINGYNIRTGWRKDPDHYIEFVLDGMNTVGGFDIRRNDMPFPSNNMDAVRLGLNIKWGIPRVNGLGVIAMAGQTIAGRNVGMSQNAAAGFVYQFVVTSPKPIK